MSDLCAKRRKNKPYSEVLNKSSEPNPDYDHCNCDILGSLNVFWPNSYCSFSRT